MTADPFAIPSKDNTRRARNKARRDAAEIRYAPHLAALLSRDEPAESPESRSVIPKAGPLTIRRGDEVIVQPAYDARTLAQVTKDRVPLTTQERTAILRRDGYRCRYCGHKTTKRNPPHVDHVLPVILGGANDPSNLVCACQRCNLRKGMQIWTPLPLRLGRG